LTRTSPLTFTYTDLLRIFAAYGQMDISVQEQVQGLISPLIRALGSTHGRLLTLLRNFPSGAESLALRIIAIFTDSGRPSAQLVTLVKALVSERDVDARFLIPIIAEMDKVYLDVAFQGMSVLSGFYRLISYDTYLASFQCSMEHRNPTRSSGLYSVRLLRHLRNHLELSRQMFHESGRANYSLLRN